MNLKELHELIQLLFEWNDSHVHQFTGANREYLQYKGNDDPEFNNFGCGGINEGKTIRELLREPQDKFDYIYDLGDNWEHLVQLEKIVPKEENKVYPVCVTGKCMAPLEDSGGIWGHYNLLAAFEHEDHPERAFLKEWVEDEFGLTDLSGLDFDKDRINEAIQKNVDKFDLE